MLLMGFGPSMFHPPAIAALSRRFADRRSFAISLHGMGGSIGEVGGPLIAAGLLALLFWRDVLLVESVPGIIAALLMWRLLRERGTARVPAAGSVRGYLASFWGLLAQKAMLMLFVVTALRAVGQAVTAIFLPIYLREDLGYSAALVGVYIAMGQLAGIGSQPWMGSLADRFGHKPVILPSLVAFALLLALLPLADGKLQLGAVILLLGVFVFSMQSILTSAAVELAGEDVHATVVSLIYASSFVGSLSPTLAGVLADAYGLSVTFVFSAVVVVVAALVFARTPLRPGPAGRG
jgi:MFS family permease